MRLALFKARTLLVILMVSVRDIVGIEVDVDVIVLLPGYIAHRVMVRSSVIITAIIGASVILCAPIVIVHRVCVRVCAIITDIVGVRLGATIVIIIRRIPMVKFRLRVPIVMLLLRLAHRVCVRLRVPHCVCVRLRIPNRVCVRLRVPNRV